MNWTLWALAFCAFLFDSLTEACSPCTCYTTATCFGRSADCSQKSLTDVPSTLPNDICYLRLENNRISTIKNITMSRLTNLQNLFLHRNKITTIEDNSFSGLTKLKYMYLDNNEITTITNSTLTGLTNLETLNLHNNNISTIEDNAFRDLTNINSLRLDNNRISSIKNITISGLTNLRNLRIQDNPYHCDCELIGLVDFLKSGRVPVSGDPRCFTPENLNGASLVSLSAANLTCSDTIDETNSAPLKEGNFLVIVYVSLCLLVKSMMDF